MHGWADSGDARLGGFGGFGTGDVLTHLWIGVSYGNYTAAFYPDTKVTRLAGALEFGSDVELSRGGANILNTTDQFRCLSIGANIAYAPGDGDINAGRYLRTDGRRVYFGDTYYLYESGGHIYWSNGAVRLD